MSGTVSYLGFGSGQDFNTMVDGLLSVRRINYIKPLENWVFSWQTKLASIGAIDSALSSFYSATKNMDSISELMVKTAASSSGTVLSASADSSALPGSYSIEVGSNIQHRLAAQGVDQASYSMDKNETWTINVGSSSFTVNVTAGQTLEQVRAAIETADDAAGDYLTAEIIDDGSSGNSARIVLTANSGGSSNSISVANNTSSLYFSTRDTTALVDTTEHSATWAGTGAVTSGGSYEGTTNKTFRFSMSGDESYTIGTDSFEVTWTDGEGNSGTISVTDGDYTGLSVFQGLTMSFGNIGDTIEGGDTFSIDVWHPDLQAAQDEGTAKAEKEVHSGFSDIDTTSVTDTDQTFSYTYNGQQRTITVNAGTTLSELKDLINNDSQNLGITAGIINDGTGLSTSFHLVLNGNQTGAAYKITSISHTLDNFDNTFNETQAAQNAMLKTDGYPAGSEYIQKSNNHVTDIIEGVALDLLSSGTSTVTVNTDTDAVMGKIEEFTEAFNSIRSKIKEVTKYDENTDSSGCLLGNYAVQIIKARLDSIVTSPAPGFQDPDDTYINLQQLGFYTDAAQGSETQGLLLLDSDKLKEALDNNPDAVADVFSALLDGTSNNNKISYDSALETATPGIYTVEADMSGLQGRFKLADGQWSDWYAFESGGASGDRYLTATDGPEKGIRLHITYPDDGNTYTATVRVKNGVLPELSNELGNLLSANGPLNNLDKHYNDIIDNIEDKIEQEEKRLLIYEERLRQSLARLDAYISNMTSIGNALGMMSAGMTSNDD